MQELDAFEVEIVHYLDGTFFMNWSTLPINNGYQMGNYEEKK